MREVQSLSEETLAKMVEVLGAFNRNDDPLVAVPNTSVPGAERLMQKATALYESWGLAQGVVYPSEVWEERHQAHQAKIRELHEQFCLEEPFADDTSTETVIRWAEEKRLCQPHELRPQFLRAGDVLSVCELALEFVETQTENREPAIAEAA